MNAQFSMKIGGNWFVVCIEDGKLIYVVADPASINIADV